MISTGGRKRRKTPEEPETELTFVRSADVARGGRFGLSTERESEAKEE